MGAYLLTADLHYKAQIRVSATISVKKQQNESTMKSINIVSSKSITNQSTDQSFTQRLKGSTANNDNQTNLEQNKNTEYMENKRNRKPLNEASV